MSALKEPAIEFRSPIAIVKANNVREALGGKDIPLLFTEVWQRRFQALWSLLGALTTGADAAALGRLGLDAPTLQSILAGLAASGDTVPPPPPVDTGVLASAPQPDVPAFILGVLMGQAPQAASGFSFITDLAANIANYAPSAYYPGLFLETDNYNWYYSTGAAWVQILYPTHLALGGLTAAFPAWRRSGTVIQARLADNSAYTAVEVLDEAYDPTAWNGSVQVPTKNAVRDKIETVTGGETGALVSDAAYGAGWNAVTGIAPSKNAVYDKVETLADRQTIIATTIPLAKITGGGADGSIDVTAQGTISGYVVPT